VHVLFLTDNYPPEVNAIATRVYERAAHWVREGHEVTVVTCFPNFPQGHLYAGWKQRLYEEQVVDGMRVIRLPTYIARNEGFAKRSLDFLSYLLAVCFAVPKLPRADVVAATSPQFFAGLAGLIVAVLKRRPFVLELSDLWPASIRAVGALRSGWLLRMLEYLELFLYRRATEIVVLTPAFKEDLVRRGVPPEKVHTVINGVDLHRYSPRPKDRELVEHWQLQNKFVVGYVGTHGMAHDLRNALSAAALLRAEKDICFMFVGDGAEKPMLEQTAREQQLTNVLFLAPQPKASMPGFWSLCDVALVHLKNDPVFADVIPSKIFEAMGMGLPLLLVAPEGEATAIVKRDSAGLCVPPARPDLLAEAVLRLASDGPMRQTFADRSYNASRKYTRKKQADDMWKVFARAHQIADSG